MAVYGTRKRRENPLVKFDPDLARLAHDVVDWHDSIRGARQEALQARANAEGAKGHLPEEVAKAYAVIQLEAEQAVAESEQNFEQAKQEFMEAFRRAQRE
jgi:hypothetical protein